MTEEAVARQDRDVRIGDAEGSPKPLGPEQHLEPAEDMPRIRVTRRRAVGFALFILAAVAFLYLVLPNLPELERSMKSSTATNGG